METYRIASLGQYYSPEIQDRDQVRFLKEEFETIDEAKAKISEIESEIYVTENNESGRPLYVVVIERKADYIESGRNQDMSNYNWDNFDGDCDGCGECSECIRFMIDEDNEYIRNNAL